MKAEILIVSSPTKVKKEFYNDLKSADLDEINR